MVSRLFPGKDIRHIGIMEGAVVGSVFPVQAGLQFYRGLLIFEHQGLYSTVL